MEEREYYGKYYEPLQELKGEVLQWLDDIVAAIAGEQGEVPVEHIRSRIKSPEGLQEKLKRKGLQENVEEAMCQISDIIGFRLVTHFVGDVYRIVQYIKEDGRYTVIKEKDYISSPKQNGYRSYHVILECPFCGTENERLRVEIQIRTIAMDCWASLEHEMRYKKHIENAALIEKELKRCAGEMASTDLSMQTLRDMIRKE
ncbi:MAG: GTP pyrophosphokinase family protein [Lachnospiraceae bacterium]|nr:GTP pyrophosphokinase family protein [Lachnospiraceae bacterium]